MRYGTDCVTRALLWLSLSACVFGGTTPAARANSPELQSGGTCNHPPSFYSLAHYKIAAIRATSPLDYLHGVRQLMSAEITATGLRLGDDFTVKSVADGRRRIRDKLNQQAFAVNLPITVNVVIAAIENCRPDAQPPSLDVVYTTFSTWAPFALPRTFEDRASQASDPARATGVLKKNIGVVPQAGYNATARFSGGGRASLATPIGKFDVNASASSQILGLGTSFSGEHAWDDGWIRAARWRVGLAYDDAPTATNHLTRARLTAQAFATSAPIGSTNAVVRFGLSIGGGHDQSNLPVNQLPAGSVSSSPIGELKTYAGISEHSGRNTFKFSYGLQLGEADTGLHIDFAKHIADGAYDVRFLPWPHKPVELNARLTGGWIQNLGAIPVAERFFGGNSEQEFLMGDSWRIRSAPFIRSIPQNRLSRLAPGAPIGGENFISANLTLGITAWNHPLMPEEIRTNPEFRTLLGSELKSAQTTLESYWISKDKAVPTVLGSANDAIAAVRELRKNFDRVQGSVPHNLEDQFSECDFQLTLAEGFADVLDKETNQSKRFLQMKSLIAEGDDGSIDNLVGCLGDLRPALGADAADEMVNRLQRIQDSARTTLAKLDKAAAQNKAARDMAFINQTVNTVVEEMNFVSVSPILTFDVARIGPQESAAGGGFRYGVGGGLRLTVLDTIRLDAGYSLNPKPTQWEGRGAVFFSLEVVSLFR